MKKKTTKKIKIAKRAITKKHEAPKRDAAGHWLPGQSANPSGKPKGLPNISEMLNEAMMKKPEGSKMNYLDAALKKIITKIVVEGDSRVIAKWWDHNDGMPSQKIDVEGDAISIVIKKPDNMKEIYTHEKTD